jgi:hypothetical protein
MERLTYGDPRFEIILKHTRDMVHSRFEMIPSVLFEKCLHEDIMPEEVLELVGSNRRECPNCGEEVEEGEPIKCTCDPDDLCECTLEEDDDRFAGKCHWKCENCERSSESEEQAYEDLPLAGPRYGGWPAAHGIVFWTTDWPQAGEYTPGIVAAANQAGFLVYEPKEFDGHILAIDGGGYDFYEAHWVPLYLALGLKWHEQDEGWQQALIKKRDHDRQRLTREQLEEKLLP